jgi:hypothetical protein
MDRRDIVQPRDDGALAQGSGSFANIRLFFAQFKRHHGLPLEPVSKRAGGLDWISPWFQ